MANLEIKTLASSELKPSDNLFKRPGLLFRLTILAHILAMLFVFRMSPVSETLMKAFENGEGDCRAIVISFMSYLAGTALVLLLFLLIPSWRRHLTLAEVISGFLSAFVYGLLTGLSVSFQAAYFTSWGFLVIGVACFLLLSLGFFMSSRLHRYERFRSGDYSTHLPQRIREALLKDGREDKRNSFVFLSAGGLLLLILILVTLSFVYDKAFGGSWDGAFFFAILYLKGAETFDCFLLLLGSYYWARWRILRPQDKTVAVMPSLLAVILLIGSLAVPFVTTSGRHDAVYYSVYSREKWIGANKELRGYMLPDFKKQVNLVGKDYATAVYYLDAPDFRRSLDDDGYALYYDVGSAWDGDDYYVVSLSKEDIVTECQMAYID
jgi:hypothetical protein